MSMAIGIPGGHGASGAGTQTHGITAKDLRSIAADRGIECEVEVSGDRATITWADGTTTEYPDLVDACTGLRARGKQ